MENLFTIKIIGMAKETESPENPGALEKRVALVPEDIKKLIKSNCTVYVENGAGEGVGYSDEDYIDVGAIIQNSEEIYKNKEMVIKFKGPSLENIHKMNPGTILFCMAHFRSFKSRAELLEKQK
ncbi:MAG: alanine dehydrogenase, partial [Bdellovibrionales bacterium]|nr:alanine dehydrogenase [Bdellovibrionales bacterium]